MNEPCTDGCRMRAGMGMGTCKQWVNDSDKAVKGDCSLEIPTGICI